MMMRLMPIDRAPEVLIVLNPDLLRGRVELFQSVQIHRSVEEGDDVFVKGLPVGVAEVVLLALMGEGWKD